MIHDQIIHDSVLFKKIIHESQLEVILKLFKVTRLEAVCECVQSWAGES